MVLDDQFEVCDRCGRKTWDVEAFGAEDRMPQPDGNPCGGRFRPPDPAARYRETVDG